MTEPAIEVRGVTKSYGRHRVLTGVDLTVAPGEIFALLGPNGAGKTTLVNILTTLIRPDAGQARVLGCNVVAEARRIRSLIGVTGQFAAVDRELTAQENLIMVARLGGLARRAARARAEALLERVDLVPAARRRAGLLSGGMLRRLDLAMSLAQTPRVLFLDEPTTGMDTRSRQALWEDITDLARHGTTVMMTTQYLEEADQLADRIAILAAGAVISSGTAAELKSAIGEEYVILEQPGSEPVQIAFDGTLAGLRAVTDHGVGSATISVRRPTLDDVFIRLTGDGAGGESTSDQLAVAR